jgi:hypothetical protein
MASEVFAMKLVRGLETLVFLVFGMKQVQGMRIRGLPPSDPFLHQVLKRRPLILHISHHHCKDCKHDFVYPQMNIGNSNKLLSANMIDGKELDM